MPAIRDWLTGTLAGRALLAGTFIKSATLALAALTGPLSALPAALDTIGGLILLGGASVLVYRLFVIVKRRMLWRVRRRLTLSYIFIGFVPAALIIVFFRRAGAAAISRLRGVCRDSSAPASGRVVEVSECVVRGRPRAKRV